MALALDDVVFSAESYQLNIPTLDGHRALKLAQVHWQRNSR
jgi:hypothetical protein